MTSDDRIRGAYTGWFFGPGANLRKDLGWNYRTIAAHPEWSKIQRFEDIPSDHRMYDQLTQTQIVHRLIIEHGKATPELFRDHLLELNERDHILGSDQYGPSTQKAVRRLLAGEPMETVGVHGVTTGGAMRCLPIGLRYFDDEESLIQRTVESCLISHNSDVAVAAAIAVNVMTAALIRGLNKQKAFTHTLRVLSRTYGKWGAPTSTARMDLRIRDAVTWVEGVADPNQLAQILGERIGYSWQAIEGIPAGFALYIATQDAKEASLVSFKAGTSHTAPEIACTFHGAEHGVEQFPPDILRKIEETNGFSIDTAVHEILDSRKTS